MDLECDNIEDGSDHNDEIDYPEEEDANPRLPAPPTEEDEQRWIRLYDTHGTPIGATLKDVTSAVVPPSNKPSREFTAHDECCICFNLLDADICCYCSSQCGTVYHTACIDNVKNSKCPTCRTNTVYKLLTGTNLFS